MSQTSVKKTKKCKFRSLFCDFLSLKFTFLCLFYSSLRLYFLSKFTLLRLLAWIVDTCLSSAIDMNGSFQTITSIKKQYFSMGVNINIGSK